jgi:hypothetical protein
MPHRPLPRIGGQDAPGRNQRGRAFFLDGECSRHEPMSPPPPASSIARLARDHTPDTARRILAIPRIARDDVDMDMHHGLARVVADVDPDVVPRRPERPVDPVTGRSDQVEDVSDLVRRQIEDVGDVPPSDGQRVARRDRIGVEHGEGVLAGFHDPIGRHRTERAGIEA